MSMLDGGVQTRKLSFVEVEQHRRAGEGRKDDQDKVRFELLPGDALRAIAVILTFGAKKYGDRNWEKGMHWSRPYGALQRHLTAWFEGDGVDEETGKSHLWHAGCCLLFLIAYELRGAGQDDRPGQKIKYDAAPEID